jgi:hypothetical protein
LATIKSCLKEQGFSAESARFIASAHRVGTRAIYDSRWKAFCAWCSENGFNAVQATTPMVADFLTFLFHEKKLAVSSIAGYRSMLSTTLREISGLELTDNPFLTALLAGFSVERPRAHSDVPAWDLSLVLSRLRQGPFEPLASADMKFLSYKVATLLALATAGRRSELRAYSKRILHAEDWSSVTLRPIPSFVAKTEVIGKPETRLTDVTIPSLGGSLGPGLEEDNKNCPVRAVKIYLSRTQAIRGDRLEFFIPFKQGVKTSIAPATISSWIQKTVRFAYSEASSEEAALLSVRAHDLRALATSWSLHSSVRLQDILRSAQWRNHNTFTYHYMKNMTMMEEGMLRLGPLVTAQSVTCGGVEVKRRKKKKKKKSKRVSSGSP